MGLLDNREERKERKKFLLDLDRAEAVLKDGFLKRVKDAMKKNEESSNTLPDLASFEYTTYTSKQLAVHGELILEYLKGCDVKIQYLHNGTWIDSEKPAFSTDVKYRIKSEPKLIYTNPLGEKFYDGDVCYYVRTHTRTGSGYELERSVLGVGNMTIDYDIGKTKESAYRLAFEQLFKDMIR